MTEELPKSNVRPGAQMERESAEPTSTVLPEDYPRVQAPTYARNDCRRTCLPGGFRRSPFLILLLLLRSVRVDLTFVLFHRLKWNPNSSTDPHFKCSF